MSRPIAQRKILWGALFEQRSQTIGTLPSSLSANVIHTTQGNALLPFSSINNCSYFASPHASPTTVPAWKGALAFSLAAAGLLGVGAVGAAEEAAEPTTEPVGSGWSVMSLESRRRIFFKYERRIRENSLLEKVFDYFASIKGPDGVRYMSALDMVHAMTPLYPASQSTLDRAGSLEGERAPPPRLPQEAQIAGDSLFKALDVNGDGLLSFSEFKLLMALLAIPQSDVATIFKVVDLDGDNSIDCEEFSLIMTQLMDMANIGGKGKQSLSRTGHKETGSGPNGLLITFFGNDQKGRLTIDALKTFLDELHSNLMRLEYAHYDTSGSGKMLAMDFARSLVAAADLKLVDGLLNKAENLPDHLATSSISLEEFQALYSLQNKLHDLQVALDFYQQVGRPLTAVDFQRMVKSIYGINLTPLVMDLLVHIFGDSKGGLDSGTLMSTMRRKDIRWCRKVSLEVNNSSAGRWW